MMVQIFSSDLIEIGEGFFIWNFFECLRSLFMISRIDEYLRAVFCIALDVREPNVIFGFCNTHCFGHECIFACPVLAVNISKDFFVGYNIL